VPSTPGGDVNDALDLYGERVSVEFVQWLRGMVRFDGVEPLIEQMAADVRRTRDVLGSLA
jgi:riboflavin kinase / FMN adenylyltransferase